MTSPCSFAVIPGKALAICGFDVTLFLLVLLLLVLLAWLLFAVYRIISFFVRSLASKVRLVYLELSVPVFVFWSGLSSLVSGKLVSIVNLLDHRPSFSPLVKSTWTRLRSVFAYGLPRGLRFLGLGQLFTGLCALCINYLPSRSADLKRTVEALRTQLDGLHEVLVISQERNALLVTQIRAAEETIATRDDALYELRNTDHLKENTIRDLVTTLDTKESTINDLEASVHTTSTSVSANASSSFAASEKTLADFNAVWGTALSTIRSRSATVSALEKVVADKDEQLASITKTVEDLHAALAETDDTQAISLEAHQTQVDELNIEIGALRSKAAHDAKSFAAAVESIRVQHEAAQKLEDKADILNTRVMELQGAVEFQRNMVQDFTTLESNLRAKLNRREDTIARNIQELAHMDDTISALKKETAITQASAQEQHTRLATQLEEKDAQLAELQISLAAAQKLYGEFENDHERKQRNLLSMLTSRDQEIENLRMQLASALTQREAQPVEYVVGALGTDRFSPSSSPVTTQSSPKFARSSTPPAQSSPTRSSSSSPVRPSSPSSPSSDDCSTSTIRPTPVPVEETSFTIEDKLAEWDVSCDLLHDDLSLGDAGIDSCESQLDLKEDVREDAQEEQEDVQAELPSSLSIPKCEASCDLLRDADSFLKHDQDSHWLKDSPVEGRSIVESESEVCSEKSSFEIPAEGASFNLLQAGDSFLAQDDDSFYRYASPPRPAPLVRGADGKMRPALVLVSAPCSPCADKKEKSSFAMLVDDAPGSLLSSNSSFLSLGTDGGATSWLGSGSGSSSSGSMAALLNTLTAASPAKTLGKRKERRAERSLLLECPSLSSFPSNLSAEFAQHIGGASTPAKRQRRRRAAMECASSQSPKAKKAKTAVPFASLEMNVAQE